MKTLISCKPCVWDVSTHYLNHQNDITRLRALRKLPIIGNAPAVKTVVFNGAPPVQYHLDKNGDYFAAGQSLLKQLELQAKLGNSKVTII